MLLIALPVLPRACAALAHGRDRLLAKDSRGHGPLAVASRRFRPLSPRKWGKIEPSASNRTLLLRAGKHPVQARLCQSGKACSVGHLGLLAIDAVLAQLLDQGGAAQAQQLGGVGDHALGAGQGLVDQGQFDAGHVIAQVDAFVR